MDEMTTCADGSACVVMNGELVVQGSWFSMIDIEVVIAVVDWTPLSAYWQIQVSFALNTKEGS